MPPCYSWHKNPLTSDPHITHIETTYSMFYKFEPLYFKRVWGGKKLKTIFGREIPEEDQIGESWDLVDRPDFQSKLQIPCQNSSIRDLLKTNHPEIMGPGWDENKRFPLLIKWLDCSERLSLQVHPPSHLAKSLNGEPKTENWYVAHTEGNSGLYIGLKKNKSKEHFIKALESEDLENVCHRIPSHPGDSILVESGRMHAIDAGNLILEIQQNSDTTYRVYDWGRKGTDGHPRKLHIEESLKCIDFEDTEPKLLKNTDEQVQLLADCKYFRIKKFKGEANQVIHLKKSFDQCIIINSIDIQIEIDGVSLSPGELGLSPFSEDCVINCKSSGNIIVTDNFHKP